MEEKEYINADRPVYFSYARNSKRKSEWEHISDCMFHSSKKKLYSASSFSLSR